MKIRPL